MAQRVRIYKKASTCRDMNSYSIFLFKDENNCHKEKSLCLMTIIHS